MLSLGIHCISLTYFFVIAFCFNLKKHTMMLFQSSHFVNNIGIGAMAKEDEKP